MPDPALRCPCGALAPDPLPAPGRVPVPCPRCGTPLTRPGDPDRLTVLRATVAGLSAAMFCAALWSFGASRLAAGLPWSAALGGAVIGLAVWLSAGARGPRLQGAAVLAFLLFLVGAEVLLYRRALEPRLVAMHAAEAPRGAETRASQELESMTWLDYLRLEVDLAWCTSVALGGVLAWWVTRAPRAVAAFAEPVVSAPASPAPEADALPTASEPSPPSA